MRRRALVAVTFAFLAGPVASAHAVTIGFFKTPDRNIVCGYAYGSTNEKPYVTCVIKSGLKPTPKRVKCAKGTYSNKIVTVTTRGKARRRACSQEDSPVVAEFQAKTLAYSKTWKHSGLRCTSRKTALSCKNARGNGFSLSRSRYRLF